MSSYEIALRKRCQLPPLKSYGRNMITSAHKNRFTMATETLAEKRTRLYGPGRALRAKGLELQKTLTKSSVLQDGEYNITKSKQGEDLWRTSFARDFLGQRLDRSHTVAVLSHVNHNFKLGNDSGNLISPHTYKQSTTKADFGTKHAKKVKILSEDRTVNWPDMAPQFRVDRDMGGSEYANSFMNQNRSSSAPTFPRVDTSKMKLPLDPTRFHVQRGSTFKFGSDEKSHLSEQQRAFGRVNALEDLTHKLPKRDIGSDVGKQMKELDNAAKVFRPGDYNDITGSMETTNMSDYGPRTRHPGEVFASEVVQKRMASQPPSAPGKSPKVRPTTDIPNELAAYARSVTVPQVFQDAEEGRDYQHNAHFKFGFDPIQKASIYGKDYALAAMAKRTVPRQHPTPDAGNLLQNDPEFSGAANSLQRIDFMAPPRQQKSTTLQSNLDKWAGDNIVMSYDLTRHQGDRQKSLSHFDYKGPPPGYRPMAPAYENGVPYPFLETEPALPYPGLPRQSEAANNFAGALSSGMYALERIRTRNEMVQERFLDRKKTHFTVGYEGPEFTSLNSLTYLGKGKNDANLKPAGKTEIKPDSEFEHLGHSLNVEDLRAADPHVTSKMDGLHSRHLHDDPEAEKAFTTSVMKSDYHPSQRLTNAQIRTVEKYEKLLAKPFAQSHFFHTDNSGRNNYVSTTMDDFIKPETMTGAPSAETAAAFKDVVESQTQGND